MCVKKECIELIYKLEPGIFMIVNMIRTNEDEIMLFSNWGTYFNRIQNPQVQLPKVEKCCMTLYKILTGEDEDGIHEMRLGKTEASASHGLGLSIKTTPHVPLITCIDEDLLKTFTKFVSKNLRIYNELLDNPPFPAWKDGLRELWN